MPAQGIEAVHERVGDILNGLSAGTLFFAAGAVEGEAMALRITGEILASVQIALSRHSPAEVMALLRGDGDGQR